MEYKTLNNGIKIPQLGYGVWQISNDNASVVTELAIKVGYRLIDTAMIYKNEAGVGVGIAQAGIPRDELFITTKVWNADHGYDNTLKAFETSLEKLGLDYVDLYLVHWPTPMFDQYIDTYKALEKLYHDGKVKAIGVCNFDNEHLERVLAECDVVPTINQIECHPYLQQHALKEFCEKHDILVEAYSPLMNGKEVLQDETIVGLAEKYEKTVAQVILRWHLQTGVIAIPKTVTPTRMEENLDVFDFALTDEDMELIARLDKGHRINSVPSEFDMR